MISVSVNTQAIANLQQWAKELEKRVGEGVQNAALAIEATAKRNCPVSSGTLRRSIQTQTEGLSAVVSSNLQYAPYVEHGTGIYADGGNGRQDVPWTYYDEASGNFYKTMGIQGTHFFQQAVDAITPNLGQYIQEAINR